MGIGPAEDREALMRAIYGSLWYRLLLDEPLDEPFIDAMARLAKCVARQCATGQSATTQSATGQGAAAQASSGG